MFSFFKTNNPVIKKRAEHCVSRTNIDPDALRVLYRLSDAGFQAYLVGGGVRDLLLGRNPKDFDVGTNAKPNEIKHIFRNCFLIGRRFRLAHIVFGRKIIETSTFRKQPDEKPGAEDIMQREDNTFGTPEEDAKRRDFTVNGLFYDIKTFSIIDYVGGLKDLERKVLRAIGDPDIRFQEDPVRMMRAVKFASRLDFTIERATRKAILKYHSDILKASPPRVCEEVFRLFSYGSSCKAFQMMWELKLLDDLLPDLSAFIDKSGGMASPVWKYLAALDKDIEEADVSNGVRVACLYYAMFKKALEDEKKKLPTDRASKINRSRIAYAVLQKPSLSIHLPRITFFGAAFMLDAPRRFDDLPDTSRGQRFLCHPDFLDAMAFKRIVLAAEGESQGKLEPWKKAYKQARAQEDSAQRSSEPPPPTSNPR